MSHLHERKEKVCLNCNTQILGRYCHICGQENVEPRESFLHLLGHFFEDLTHFDGKFFSTLKPLFFKPGFLSEQYMLGRRASYLNPIRMYLFISAMFFLLLMTFFIHPDREANENRKSPPSALGTGLIKLGEKMEKMDSLQAKESEMTVGGGRVYINDYETLAQYDSIQNLLPEDKKDGRLKRYIIRQTFGTIEYSNEHKDEARHRIIEKFFHSLPYMLFISLPLVALLLMLLYWRRKNYYYVTHIIFTIHLYCFTFLLFILTFIFKEFGQSWNIVSLILRLSAFVYLYIAMLRFYKQGYFKTFVKFILLVLVGGMMIVLLTALVALNTFLSVAS